MTPTPAPAAHTRQPSRTSGLAVVVFLLLICSPCLGLGGGVAFLAGQSDGRFARWRSLAAPPETAESFVAADPFQVYVSTQSGQVYVCGHNQAPADGQCWRPAEAPYAVAAETDYEHSVFAGEAPPPPGDTTDAVYVALFRADAANEARYVLLTDGTVWVWEYATDANQSLLILLAGPVLGLALAGVVILALLVLSASQRRRAEASVG